MLITIPTQRHLGLQAVGTEFMRNGVPFRGIGVNHFALFVSQVQNMSITLSPDTDIRTIKQTWGLPVIRFSVGFWSAATWLNGWYNNKANYFAQLDAVVASAEAHGVGLIPCLFWNMRRFAEITYDVYGAYSNQPDLANKSSNIWALASEFITDVVGRYHNSPAIWGWELTNEMLSDSGPEYYSGWLMDGTGKDSFSNPLPWLNWGTKPGGGSYPASDKMSLANYIAFTQNAVALIRSLDGHGRFVSSGSAPGNAFAVNAQTTNTVSADTVAQWDHGMLSGKSWPAYRDQWFSVVTSHNYPNSLVDGRFFDSAQKTAGQFITLMKGWADACGKPYFQGEFGATYHGDPVDEISSDLDSETTNFNEILAAIVANDVRLSCLWNYGGPITGVSAWQKWDVTDASRIYQLEAVAVANSAMGN